MSDFSQGPGWWQASDGKWYPPEQAPGAVPTPPPGAPPAYGAPAPGYGAAPGYAAAPGMPGASAWGPLASWGERVVAYLIDGLIILVGFIALFIVTAILSAISDSLGAIVLILGYIALLCAGIYFAYLAGAQGGSPGMRLRGLKLVGEADGQLVGGGQGVLRWFVGQLISAVTCGIAGLLDILWPLWDANRQTLHDKIVKTLVLTGQPQEPFGPDLFKK